MKHLKLILLAFILCLTSTFIFAQDSTIVHAVTPFLQGFEAKYTWIAPTLGVLFLLSEVLAYIPSIKSNSVFQLIASWVKVLAPKG